MSDPQVIFRNGVSHPVSGVAQVGAPQTPESQMVCPIESTRRCTVPRRAGGPTPVLLTVFPTTGSPLSITPLYPSMHWPPMPERLFRAVNETGASNLAEIALCPGDRSCARRAATVGRPRKEPRTEVRHRECRAPQS
jgi:hypothetical protein